jgi:hypothetical protein
MDFSLVIITIFSKLYVNLWSGSMRFNNNDFFFTDNSDMLYEANLYELEFFS